MLWEAYMQEMERLYKENKLNEEGLKEYIYALKEELKGGKNGNKN